MIKLLKPKIYIFRKLGINYLEISKLWVNMDIQTIILLAKKMHFIRMQNMEIKNYHKNQINKKFSDQM